MSERVQLTVPDAVAASWKEQAEKAGVPLSSWVVMQIQEPAGHTLTRIEKQLDLLRIGMSTLLQEVGR